MSAYVQLVQPAANRNVLTRIEAQARAQRVRRVHYDMLVDLEQGAPGFVGRTSLDIDIERPGVPLHLDFSGTVTALRIEGEPSPIEHRDHRLWIDPDRQAERLRVEVEYRKTYDLTGDGLYRFIDPEDGCEYIFSNLQPFAAHRIFPCFDQPDIKGTYRLRVRAPAHWRVVSSQAAVAVAELPDGRREHDFGASLPFSTYLMSIVAGPLEEIRDEHAGIALGLLARRSMRPHLEAAADEIIELTGQGLDFYRRLFDQPFPFHKLDQVFVPELNAGAMENVGAVTLNDRYLFRDPPTHGQRLERAETVLHELAHMWFGNLVTPCWWDDLWLNESFATYISYFCLAETTRFSDAWQYFNGQLRPAACRADQLVTTHPIAADAPDTEAAVGNFDAITYEKGAAVLKQLVAAIGQDAFREGMRAYFDRHAWGNASLADFLLALSQAAERDLGDWAQAWLSVPGIDTIGVRWQLQDGRISDLTVWQTAPAQRPIRRSHATRVGLLHGAPGDGDLRVTGLPVVLEGPEVSVAGAVGLEAPLFVFPNLEDHDYAIARLDDASLRFALRHLPSMSDPLLRQQVWSSLWETVRDARLPAWRFLSAVRAHCPDENDTTILEATLGRATEALSAYVPDGQLGAGSSALVATALAALGRRTEPEIRTIWARAAIAAAATPADLEPFLALADGRDHIDGFSLDQDMRWSLTVKVAAHGLPGAAERLAEESSRDRSDRGARARLKAEVAVPDPDSKRRAWQRIHGAGYGSDYLTRMAMSGFQWRHQRELLMPYREPFFRQVRDMHARSDHALARAYVSYLIPDRWAEREVLERIAALSDELGEGEALLRRQLAEVADDLARMIRVRAASTEPERVSRPAGRAD